MIDSILHNDVELLIYLNNLGNIQWDSFWLLITNKFSAIPLYIFLLYYSFKQFGAKKTLVLLLFVVLLIAVSDQTSNLFKNSFKRLRPCHDETVRYLIRLVKERCGGLYSYFSAHAANTMAIAVFFGLLFKEKLRYFYLLLIFWAITVSYSRIYLGVHYPLDVLTGMFFGMLYGFIFYRLFTRFSTKFMK